MSTLYAFDLDDTLFYYDDNTLCIHVIDQNGNRIDTLNNKQYNTHDLQDGHAYDFSDFRSSETFQNIAKPIHKTINKLKELCAQGQRVEIITARSDMDDKHTFANSLLQHGIDINQIHVRRSGNLGPNPAPINKKKMVSDLIDKHKYSEVHLYDDQIDNLHQFLTLRSDYPYVNFIAHCVKYDKLCNDVTITNIS